MIFQAFLKLGKTGAGRPWAQSRSPGDQGAGASKALEMSNMDNRHLLPGTTQPTGHYWLGSSWPHLRRR